MYTVQIIYHIGTVIIIMCKIKYNLKQKKTFNILRDLIVFKCFHLYCYYLLTFDFVVGALHQ